MENARTQRAKFSEQVVHRSGQLRIGNHARDEADAAGLRRADLISSQDQMCGRAHPDELGQGDHRNGRKAAELDFRLAKLRGFRGKNKITESREFHPAAKTIAVHASRKSSSAAFLPLRWSPCPSS